MLQVVWGVPADGGPASEATPLAHLRLPTSKHRWVTAAVILPLPDLPTDTSPVSVTAVAETGLPLPDLKATPTDTSPVCVSAVAEELGLPTDPCLLVCGDRKGSLHVFHTSPSKEVHITVEKEKSMLVTFHLLQWVEPLQTLRGVHGSNGVTHVSLRSGLLASCGRDGHCRTFSLHPLTGLKERSHHRVLQWWVCVILVDGWLDVLQPVKGMDWVEKEFHSDDDHLVLGFHAVNTHYVGDSLFH